MYKIGEFLPKGREMRILRRRKEDSTKFEYREKIRGNLDFREIFFGFRIFGPEPLGAVCVVVAVADRVVCTPETEVIGRDARGATRGKKDTRVGGGFVINPETLPLIT